MNYSRCRETMIGAVIVRADAGHLLLITQPDHAALAAELIAAWRGADAPPREQRPTVLFATREHDNGWTEPDASPEIDPSTLRPYDFVSAPDRVKQAVWPRALARLGPDFPEAAALVAEHALTVLGHYRDDPTWRQFFADVTAERERLLRRCGADSGDRRALFERCYRSVYLGDLLSLVFCTGWKETFEREKYRIRLNANRLEVSPDPFEGIIVPLRVRARRVPDRPYSSGLELRDVLSAAPETALIGVAVGC